MAKGAQGYLPEEEHPASLVVAGVAQRWLGRPVPPAESQSSPLFLRLCLHWVCASSFLPSFQRGAHMRIPAQSAIAFLMFFFVLIGCSQDQEGGNSVKPEARPGVSGKTKGGEVSFANSEFDGSLALFEGEFWGWSPGMLITLFSEDQRPSKGYVIDVHAKEGSQPGNPYIQCRWRDPSTGEMRADVF